MKIEVNTIILTLMLLVQVFIALKMGKIKEVTTQVYPAIETIKLRKHEINAYNFIDSFYFKYRDSIRASENPY